MAKNNKYGIGSGEEAEVRERYPFLVDDEDGPDIVEYVLGQPQDLIKVADDGSVTVDYEYMVRLDEEHLPNLKYSVSDNYFTARPARSFFEGDGAEEPPKLFGDYWRAGELAILYADTGSGKSTLAVQIAQAIASGVPFNGFAMTAPAQRVVYFDLELSDSQFAARYSSGDSAHAAHFPFHKNLIRCAADKYVGAPDEYRDFSAFICRSIVEFTKFSLARVVIIDNITWLSAACQAGSAAARVMKTLQHMKRELGLSILVLAHTPKRPVHSAVDINHLQGSKMLSNFADSVFAIGTSRRGPDIRYLKTVKQRNAAANPSETGVAAIKMVKEDCFLGFEFDGWSDERDHVGWLSSALEPEKVALANRAVELREKNMTQREIAEKLGVSAATINRCLKGITKE